MSIRYFNFFLFLLILLSNLLSPLQVKGKNISRRPAAYYFRKGMLQYRAEMYDYAILNLQMALDGNPKLFRALNTLADIFIKRNNKQKGVELLERSLAINGSQEEIHNRLGELYSFFTDDRRARYHFQEAVKLKPDDIKANLSLSRYYLLEGNRELSEKHFRKSYDTGKKKAARFFREGMKAYSDKKYEKAGENLKRAIDLSPAYTEAYVALADVYRNRERFREAADVMERLKFIRPDYEKAYLYLGSIYFNRRLPGKRIYFINLAIKNLEKAIRINPRNPDTCFFLADIYRFTGDPDTAKKYERMGLEREEGDKN